MGKSFWSIQISKETHGKCLGVCENFSFLELRYECVMLAWLKGLKKLYRANTISSSIFLVGGTQTLILDTTLWQEEPLMASVVANVVLYCTDLVLFETDALDGWS